MRTIPHIRQVVSKSTPTGNDPQQHREAMRRRHIAAQRSEPYAHRPTDRGFNPYRAWSA